MKNIFFSVCIARICSLGFAQEPQSNPLESMIEVFNLEIEEEQLFVSLSNEIAAMDHDSLLKQPEILLHKVDAGIESLWYLSSYQEMMDRIMVLKSDLMLAYEYAPQDSILQKATAMRIDCFDKVILPSGLDDEILLGLMNAYNEAFLMSYARISPVSALQLREEVFENLKQSPELELDFFNKIFMLVIDIDLVLGKAHLIETRCEGVIQEEDDVYLLVKVAYTKDNKRYEYHIQI